MDQETLGNIVLLVIVTLISVVQNGKRSLSLGQENKGKFFVSCVKVRLTQHSKFSLCTFVLVVFVSFLFECIEVCVFPYRLGVLLVLFFLSL